MENQKKEKNQEVINYFSAQLLARAVSRLYPGAVLGGEASHQNGFYAELLLSHSIKEKELKDIEAEMERILGQGEKWEHISLSLEEAIALFSEKGEYLKAEQLCGMDEESVLVCRQGEYMNISNEPLSISAIKAFKLHAVAGSYWKGDKSGHVLQRISGAAFASRKEMVLFEKEQEELKKRDHRKIGKEMELFLFSEEAPGMPFFLPNGQIMRSELQSLLREVQGAAGYQEVSSPFMMNERLWRQSGHWDHYHENMYFSDVDKETFALKPMNCPGHMIMFNQQLFSYRDLPVRYAEFGQVHRHEYSGALNGLLRVRTFCQDDAHLFVRPDQIQDEVKSVLDMIDYVYRTLGFDYSVELSTRPENSMGDDELWQDAEAALQEVLDEMGMPYRINEGDGAFYGPKIDFHIKDAMKRSHQCATVQLDFQMPVKFDCSYISEKNEKERPVVIHRAIAGSLDRFLGILIEHFAGVFPLWLAPVQAVILPVAEVHRGYAEEVKNKLAERGIRVQIDASGEKLGYKIRKAQKSRVPYMLILGDQEMSGGHVNVRKHGEKQSLSIEIEELADHLREKIEKRELS
ncbi:threonine--tRNA ligase [Metabacillus sp. JX24]|uniref:threonine--tRNA ligase n=1 Tax=Metabacillus sp. JX24 TaxID=3240759 RepID=UPI0035100F83